MERVLFIGNGFNQVSDGGSGWNQLLNTLAGVAATEHEEEIRKAKPFTLWFEEIRKNSSMESLKKVVAAELSQRLGQNEHHSDVMGLGFKHVLTTNYDHNLEAATGNPWESNLSAPENFYSLFRRRSYSGQHVWHIHGDLDNTQSIMLGHQQYSGYLHKIRSYLTNGVETTVAERNGKRYKSKFARGTVRKSDDVETWVDLFLEHEVHIVGFSFDYTENHLWNLLMEKQRLKSKVDIVGQTIFHRCSNKKQATADEAKLSILSALGVTVVDHTSTSYSASYDKCIRALR